MLAFSVYLTLLKSTAKQAYNLCNFFVILEYLSILVQAIFTVQPLYLKAYEMS